jgi:glycosyltransferase involved in cell wall biosynthesis
MKVAFDYQVFSGQRFGGISRYFASLAREMLALGICARIVAPMHMNRYLELLPSGVVRGRLTERFSRGRAGRLRMMYNRAGFRIETMRWMPDVVHETYYSEHRSASARIPTVVTVFDMIHELFAEQFPFDRTTVAKAAAIRRAEHIICISHNTRDDLMRLFNVDAKRISVVHLAADAPPAAAPSLKPADAPFLLYVGDRRGYKNFDALLRAVASSPLLRSEFRILAFGGHPFSETELLRIRQLDLQSLVERETGDDRTLDFRYRQASALVYPSLYEGFGLPPLEAMARGCPVVASNTSSIPEVIGDAAAYFDPRDAEDIRHAIEAVIASDDLRDRLVRQGHRRAELYSWNRCATETRAVYRAVVS